MSTIKVVNGKQVMVISNAWYKDIVVVAIMAQTAILSLAGYVMTKIA